MLRIAQQCRRRRCRHRRSMHTTSWSTSNRTYVYVRSEGIFINMHWMSFGQKWIERGERERGSRKMNEIKSCRPNSRMKYANMAPIGTHTHTPDRRPNCIERKMGKARIHLACGSALVHTHQPMCMPNVHSRTMSIAVLSIFGQLYYLDFI